MCKILLISSVYFTSGDGIVKVSGWTSRCSTSFPYPVCELFAESGRIFDVVGTATPLVAGWWPRQLDVRVRCAAGRRGTVTLVRLSGAAGLGNGVDKTCWAQCVNKRLFTVSCKKVKTRGWALDRVHNSHRPCGAVSLSGVTAHRYGAARLSRRDFLTLWPLPLTFWPNINWWARYRDGLSLYHVWRFYFQPFWFYRADRITDRQTEPQRRINATVGVSKHSKSFLVGLHICL